MKLAIGHMLTSEGRQAVGILDGLLQSVGLPNIEPLRAYAALKHVGMASAQIFCDNPSLEDGVSHWLTSGAAQQWIAAQNLTKPDKPAQNLRTGGKWPGTPPAKKRPASEHKL